MSASDRFNARVGRFVDTARVESIRNGYKTTVDQIRTDAKLSSEGRKVEIAKAHVAAKTQLNELKGEFRAAVGSEKSRLEKRWFGPGTADPLELISHRDAFDRADNLGDQKSALELLRRASIAGDAGLARAVLYKAHNRWPEVVQEHDRVYPGSADGLKELRDLPEGPQTEGMLFSLGTPEEFESEYAVGMSADHEIEQWAERE